MNQLSFLENIYARLKPGGKLYLSTPRLWFFAYPHGSNYSEGHGNYVELYPGSLRVILRYVGFTITREEVHNPWPFKFIFFGFLSPIRWFLTDKKERTSSTAGMKFSWWLGFRPVVRFLFNRFTIVECVQTIGGKHG
jgi:hypothetical protein